MVKIYNSKRVKERRKELRSNLSVPELIFWKNIKNKQVGYKFRRQYSIDNYIVDFYSPKLNLVIELDGDSHATERGELYDKIRTEYFKKLNLKIKRYTNRDVLYNIGGVLEDLCKFIEGIDQNPT